MEPTPDSQIPVIPAFPAETTIEPQTSASIKFIRIFLLALIVIGIGLLCTINLWVPKLVGNILSLEGYVTTIPIVATTRLHSSIAPDSVTYEMRTSGDGNSTTTMPFILNDPNTTAVASVNAQIQKLVADESCSSAGDQETADSMQSNITALQVYSQNDTFSFSYSVDSYCGGAHPDNFEDAITFDMKTGKEIDLPDLFANYQRDQVAIDAILSAAYAKEQNEQEPTDPQDVSDCISSMNPSDPDNTFFISHEEMMFLPSFAFVEEPCQIEVPVTTSSLKPYLAPSGILQP